MDGENRRKVVMKYVEFDQSRPMDLVLLGRVAIDFKRGVQTTEESSYV